MSLKIFFMGTPDFAVPILKTLYQSSHKIMGVYTQPPKKKNRGQKTSLSSVHKYSEENNDNYWIKKYFQFSHRRFF